MTVRPKRDSRAGNAFTLIEVLLALAIAATVLASVNAIFFGALHLRSRTVEVTENLLPTDRAINVMKRDLRGILPIGTLAGPMASDTTAIGMSQPVLLELFTTSAIINEETPWGDVQRIDYALQEPTNRMNSTSNGKDLVRNVTHNLLATTPETPEPQVLLSDVQRLQFSYFDGTNWLDTWSVTLSNIPVAIRVEVTFATPKSGEIIPGPIQFVVPVVSQSRTNQTDLTN